MVKEDQIKLMQTIIDQQEKRIQEKDAVIADLRKLVDELQSLKANLEETLKEFQRQFFGVRVKKQKLQIRNRNSECNCRTSKNGRSKKPYATKKNQGYA